MTHPRRERPRALNLLPADRQLAGEEAVKLADLKEETWVATREGTVGRSCVARLCADAGFAPHIDYRSDDYAAIRGFVRAGLGIAVTPALGYQHTEQIEMSRLAGVTAQRHVKAVYLSVAANPVVPHAVHAFRKAAGTLAPEYTEIET